jgi:methanogenic corrinoid protein MtbC1
VSDRDLYLEAIVAGNRQAAIDVAVGAIEAGMDVRDVYVEILQESLYEVGRMWESNRISVSTEHLATAITQTVLARLYERLPRPDAVRGRMVLTGVEGELHQVGGHMVSDALESDGWDVKFLGTNVPAADVLTAISAYRPAVLGISCTMLENLSKVSFLIGAVRETFQASSPRIVVGGGAFRAAPGRAAELGADAWAPDMRAAIGVTRSLAPSV